MCGENVCPNARQPPAPPALGTLMVDTARGDRVGEFRGVAGLFAHSSFASLRFPCLKVTPCPVDPAPRALSPDAPS